MRVRVWQGRYFLLRALESLLIVASVYLPGTAKLKEEFGDAVCTSNFDVVSQASFCDCGPLLKQPLMASNCVLWLALPIVYMLDPGAAASASSPPSEERRRLELSADRAPAVVPPAVPRKHGRAAGAGAGARRAQHRVQGAATFQKPALAPWRKPAANTAPPPVPWKHKHQGNSRV